MEKTKQINMNYNSISKNESFIIALIKRHDLTVFGVRELNLLSNLSKNQIHNTLFSLTKKNLVTRIKRDVYTITEHLNENIYKIATTMVIPSYISFWTALSYYGFTEQQIQTIQLVSTKQAKELKFNFHLIKITTFQPREFYGYKKINGFIIAEKEKAIIDSLFQIEKCGGLNEYIKCLNNAWDHLNKKTFIRYLKKFQNKSLTSRLGYIIETLELSNHSHVAETLQNYKSQCPIKLNPQNKKTGKYNQKWNILINDKIGLEDIK